eukprot:5544280-Amphidinium_carterae.1
MAKPEKYKPSHRLVGKQPPPIVAMLDEVHATNELQLTIEEQRGRARVKPYVEYYGQHFGPTLVAV